MEKTKIQIKIEQVQEQVNQVHQTGQQLEREIQEKEQQLQQVSQQYNALVSRLNTLQEVAAEGQNLFLTESSPAEAPTEVEIGVDVAKHEEEEKTVNAEVEPAQ